MKFLDYPELQTYSEHLTFESAECKVFTRLEAYSCKPVSKEKRLYRELENAWQQAMSNSPSSPAQREAALASPFGRLDDQNARKTLFLLIALLNGVFPDHDFSQVNPGDFRKEPSPDVVMHSLSSTLHNLRNSNGRPRSYSTFTGSFDDAWKGLDETSSGNSLSSSARSNRRNYGMDGASHREFKNLLDDIMDIRDCEVYTFHPDMDSDPHACAEPDEEGGRGYEDDGWSEDGDIEMQSVNVVTPRRGSIDLDDPMFDEDYQGGFTSGSSAMGRGGPRTPQTPVLGSHASPSRSASSMRKTSQRPIHSTVDYYHHPGSYSSADSSMDDDDDVDGTGGLLWSTYAFFYNRKLRRVLFVTVWSRSNSSIGQSWTSPLLSAYGQPHQAAPTTLSLPSSVSTSKAQADRPTPTTIDLTGDDSNHSTPNPSPVKIALTRNASAARARLNRVPSGSPAPSSLSPFPHANAITSAAAASSPFKRITRRQDAIASTSTSLSLDGAAQSIAASSQQQQSDTPAMSSSASSSSKRAADQESSIGKRTRRQVAA